MAAIYTDCEWMNESLLLPTLLLTLKQKTAKIDTDGWKKKIEKSFWHDMQVNIYEGCLKYFSIFHNNKKYENC